ncbi:V-type ATPase subunit [Kitasatospora sp. NPDC001132]
MAAGWVGGVTRARGLLSRCLGRRGAGELAAAGTLTEAVRSLAATPYRRFLPPDPDLAEAQRAVSATLLWHLRVLAGWLPRSGAQAVRALAAGFETANIEDLLRSFAGPAPRRPYALGALAIAWRRAAHARTPEELRAALAASAWGDPGGADPATAAVALRMSAAYRVAEAVPHARRWAQGRAALLTARTAFVVGRPLPGNAVRQAARLLGPGAVAAASFEELRRALPADARWALDGIETPGDLWRAESRWWTVVDREGRDLLRGAQYGLPPVVGVVAVLSADAWRVRAALELAAHGGVTPEVADALG